MNDSRLKAGKIPANTVCPFRAGCAFAQDTDAHHSMCHHQGEDHPIEYSCGAARAFDLMERNRTK
jgi:alcohol dehydrogenase class IV